MGIHNYNKNCALFILIVGVCPKCRKMLSEMKTETVTPQVAFEESQVTCQMEKLSLVREYELTFKH